MQNLNKHDSSSLGIYGFSLKTALISFRKMILFVILKCPECDLIFKMVAPLVLVLKSLNIFNFLSFYPFFITFTLKCVICQDPLPHIYS